MNTFTVYLIMQATTLWGVLLTFAILGCMVKLFCAIVASVNLGKAIEDKAEATQDASEYQRRADKSEGSMKVHYLERVEEVKSKAAVAEEKLKHAQSIFEKHNFRSLSKFAVVMTVILGVLPSTSTLCAAYVIPAVANSQAVQKDFPELYDLAISRLKDQLKPVTEAAK